MAKKQNLFGNIGGLDLKILASENDSNRMELISEEVKLILWDIITNKSAQSSTYQN